MCKNWNEFSDLRKNAQTRIKVLPHKLEYQDLSQDDIDAINDEIQQSMSEWKDEHGDIEHIMASSHDDQRPVVSADAALPVGAPEPDDNSQQDQDFEQQKQCLLEAVAQAKDKLQQTGVNDPTVEDVKEYSI